MNECTEETGDILGAHMKPCATESLMPPLRAEPGRPNHSNNEVPRKSATPSAGESQEVHPKVPVQKSPVKHQEPASLSPRVVTTRRGRVVKPPARFADY